MQSERHDKARFLLDRSAIEGISPEEQRWLAEHLSQCADCSRYAELSRRAIFALDSIAFDVDPAVVGRVEQAVLHRAEQRPRFSTGVTAAAILTILGSAALWQSLASIASRWQWPAPQWQFVFIAVWVLPSIFLDVLLVFAAKAGGQRQ